MKKVILLGLLFLFFIPYAKGEVVYFDECPSSVISDSNLEIYLTNDVSTTTYRCFYLTGNNITIDCQGHKITGSRDITIGVEVHGSNYRIRNCVFDNVHSVIGVSGTGGSINITNVRAINSHSFGGFGINTRITNCSFDNGDVFLDFYGNMNNPYVLVDYCNITNSTYGFKIGSFYGWPSRLEVTNSRIENVIYAFHFYATGNKIVINNSIIKNNDYGLYFSSFRGNVKAWNNIFNNTVNIYFGPNVYIYDVGLALNIQKTPGTNIVGGPYLGGNWWSSYSENCSDEDKDWICDEPLVFYEDQWKRIADNLPLTICYPDWVLISNQTYCYNETTIAINQTYHDLNGCYPDYYEIELINCPEGFVCEEGECVKPRLTIYEKLLIIGVFAVGIYLFLSIER